MTIDSTSTGLSDLPHDVAAVVLSHLGLRDVARFARASRALRRAAGSDAVWKPRFLARWSPPRGATGGGWRTRYARAHAHPHDLWAIDDEEGTFSEEVAFEVGGEGGSGVARRAVTLFNPSFSRPLAFRVYARRPDVFVAAPAEGLLAPGRSTTLRLGAVVPRDADDDDLSSLPSAPYLLRHVFAPVLPCGGYREGDDHRRQGTAALALLGPPTTTTTTTTASVVDRAWADVDGRAGRLTLRARVSRARRKRTSEERERRASRVGRRVARCEELRSDPTLSDEARRRLDELSRRLRDAIDDATADVDDVERVRWEALRRRTEVEDEPQRRPRSPPCRRPPALAAALAMVHDPASLSHEIYYRVRAHDFDRPTVLPASTEEHHENEDVEDNDEHQPPPPNILSRLFRRAVGGRDDRRPRRRRRRERRQGRLDPEHRLDDPDVDDAATPVVDPDVLRAARFWSRTLSAAPIVVTLVLRWTNTVTPSPLHYHLEGLPFASGRRLRYLTDDECGVAAAALLVVWAASIACLLTDGRRRNDLSSSREEESLLGRWWRRTVTVPRRDWDAEYARRSLAAIDRDRRRDVPLATTTTTDGPYRRAMTRRLSVPRSITRWALGLAAIATSFCVSSPHFVLNVLTIFYCSVAFGFSVAIQSLETGAEYRAWGTSPSLFRSSSHHHHHLSTDTLVAGSILVGHAVGCSGGVLFLVEFVVTAVSLLLGGAATVSTNAVSSWAHLSSLLSVAACGAVASRAATVDGVRNRRPCPWTRRAAVTAAACQAALVWACAWDTPASVMIVRAGDGGTTAGDGAALIDLLQ